MAILFFFFFYTLIIPLGEVSSSPLFLIDFLPMKISFLISLMSLVFISLVCTIALMVFSWSRYYMSSSNKLLFFYALLLGFVSSMLLLILSNSLMSLFLGWEGLGITSFVLIIFFQNWMSTNGGLLTLLTNRLGDAVLMVSVCYWLCLSSFSFYMSAGSVLIVFISLVSFTKSAQWPFVSWLPAAMAAPTPVSALVHSSTLVTAGTWLVLRMGQLTLVNFSVWLMLGTVTLAVASMAALMEVDAKKIVALSTLSQLGLMFIALALGNVSMCLCHILTHALAKSNLFLVVGTVLHSRFSEQDSRSLSNMMMNLITMSATISVLSLSGVLFLSGFFSKEQILMGHYKVLSSLLGLIVLVALSSLTLAYCLKLIMIMSHPSSTLPAWANFYSLMMTIPLIALSSMTVIGGYFFIVNFGSTFTFIFNSLTGLYWIFLSFSLLILSFSTFKKSSKVLLFKGFSSQLLLLDLLKKSGLNAKHSAIALESSVVENFYFLSSLSLSYLFVSFIKSIVPLSVIFIMTLGF